jgi:chromosome partitioning protein
VSTILTLYNHKGGVSKTTTSFNLAHALVEHCGVRVLLVDADPQCNLTELALAPLLSELEDKIETTGDLGELPGTSILEALRPRFDGDRPQVDVDAIELLEITDSGDLCLFRGDVDLNEAEDRLSQAHSQRVTDDMHQRRTYVAVHDMLRRLADNHEFDFVIVDVGPSAGALTRSFFLACDRFLVPVAPDRFNYQAIGSLSRILGKWITEHRQIVSDFRAMGLNVSDGTPVLHGLVMQRYQRYAKEPKKSFKVWMERIAQRARDELLPRLVAVAGTEDVVATALATDPTVASIPDFSGLGPIMLAVGKPVWRIEKSEADFRGVVWEQAEERLNDFRETHYELAQSLVEATA